MDFAEWLTPKPIGGLKLFKKKNNAMFGKVRECSRLAKLLNI